MTCQIIEISSFRGKQASKALHADKANFRSYDGNLALDETAILESGCGDEKEYNMKCQICEDLDSKLQDFIDGELDQLSRQRLLGHLNACPDFKSKLEEYQILKLAAASLDSSTLYSSSIATRLRNRLNSELDFKNKL